MVLRACVCVVLRACGVACVRVCVCGVVLRACVCVVLCACGGFEWCGVPAVFSVRPVSL